MARIVAVHGIANQYNGEHQLHQDWLLVLGPASQCLVGVGASKGRGFGVAAGRLAAAGALQWRRRTAPCPIDPVLRQACLRTRRWSRWVWLLAVVLFCLGALFAFVAPLWMGGEAG